MFGYPYLIAETAYIHEGDFDYLRSLVKMTPGKVDAVKFHLLFDLDDYMSGRHPLYGNMKNWLFSESQWRELFGICSDKGVDVIALCDDIKSIEFANKQKEVSAIELHATSLNEVFMLEACALSDKGIVLGIGGCSYKEIEFALDVLSKNKERRDILLMYGFQSFPTDYANIRLARLFSLMDKFKGVSWGYADHTIFDDPLNAYISALPVSFGVGVIEKHYAIEKGKERIDYQAAVSVEDLIEIKDLMCSLAKMWDNGNSDQAEPEKRYGEVGPMRKAIVFRRDLPAGHRIEKEDLAYKRTANRSVLKQSDIFKVIGMKLSNSVKKDDIVDFDLLI